MCTHPGCEKRFSRSDELTRHSRIHTDREGTRNAQHHAHHQQQQHGPVPIMKQEGQNQFVIPPASSVSQSAQSMHASHSHLSLNGDYGASMSQEIQSGFNPKSRSMSANDLSSLSSLGMTSTAGPSRASGSGNARIKKKARSRANSDDEVCAFNFFVCARFLQILRFSHAGRVILTAYNARH